MKGILVSKMPLDVDSTINWQIARAQKPLLGVILCCTSIPPEKRVSITCLHHRTGRDSCAKDSDWFDSTSE